MPTPNGSWGCSHGFARGCAADRDGAAAHIGALIRDHVKFRVGRIVYAAVSPDEERLGFGFPREERAALVASRPQTFMMPLPSDERYQWVRARLPVLDVAEL